MTACVVGVPMTEAMVEEIVAHIAATVMEIKNVVKK